MINFELIFVQGKDIGLRWWWWFFICDCPVAPILLVEKAIFFPSLNCSFPFVKSDIRVNLFLILYVIPVICMSVSLHQYYSLDYSSEIMCSHHVD